MTRENTPDILEWRKQKQYRCRLCAFDSLDKAQFEDHFAKVHAPFQVLEGLRATQTPSDTAPATEPEPEPEPPVQRRRKGDS